MTVASVLIIGASVAGLGVANELRRSGYAGTIVLTDAQPHMPYDRPPLSKAALASPDVATAFHDESHYRDNRIMLRLGSAATALDADARTVTFADGGTLSADAIVIATGARARRLPAAIAPDSVHVVRDLDDTLRLREELQPGRHLAMIGGSFIGAEVASMAVKLGLEATLIDAALLPMESVLGPQIAERILRQHEAAGIRLQLSSPVERIVEEGSRKRILLSNGDSVLADVIVAGLGAVPNIEWLRASGLELADGVLCDELGRTSAEGIFVAGDVAGWRNPSTGVAERHEHWTAAREQGRIVAQQIVGARDTRWCDFVPYFWSDIHGRRIQLLGTMREATDCIFVYDDADKGAFLAEYNRGDALIGVVGCNAGARLMRYMPRLQGT